MKRKLIVLMAIMMAAVTTAFGYVKDYSHYEVKNGVRYRLNPNGEAYVADGQNNVDPVPSGAIVIVDKITYEGENYPVTRIYNSAFQGRETSYYQITSVDIPNSVKDISSGAFERCQKLTTVKIGKGVTGIYGSAFQYCTSLSEIFINAETPPTLGANAFANTNSTFRINVPEESVSKYKEAENWSAFADRIFAYSEYQAGYSATVGDYDYTILSKEDKTVSVKEAEGKTYGTAITFPETIKFPGDTEDYSVTTVAADAFKNCAEIQSITIPASIASIGDGAFAGCSNLKTITLQRSTMTSIGTGAFAGIAEDAEIYVPAELFASYTASDWNSVGTLIAIVTSGTKYTEGNFTYTLYPKSKLASVAAAQGATIAGELTLPTAVNAFGVDYKVTTVTAEGFMGQTGITVLNIPKEFTMISKDAFKDCTSLAEINVAQTPNSYPCKLSGNPFSGIATGAVCNLPFYQAKTYYNEGWKNVAECRASHNYGQYIITVVSFEDGLAEYSVPEGTALSGYVFVPGTLTNHFNGALLDAVYTIKMVDNCFKNQTGLTKAKIESSHIGQSAFEGCTGLEIVSLVGDVDEIAANAFSGCGSLVNIYSIGKKVAEVGTGAFTGINEGCKVRVNHKSVEAYKSAWGGIFGESNILSLNYIKFTCQADPKGGTYELEPANRDNSGFGSEYVETIFEPVVGTSYYIGYSYFAGPVTTIPDYAYNKMPTLRTIEIPETVETIGKEAFSYCSGLKSINIPNSVTTLGEQAFMNCPDVRSITIGTGLTSIMNREWQLFVGCQSIESITFFGDNPPTTNMDAPINIGNFKPVIYVPAGKVNNYKTATNWKKYSYAAIPTNYALTDPEYTGYARPSDYYQPYDVENCTVTYTRDFPNTNWQGLFLPFGMKYDEWKDLGVMAELTAVDDGELVWKTIGEGGKTEAGKPYIFKPAEATSTTFTATGTTLRHFDCLQPVAIDGYVLSGTYVNKTDMAARKAYALSAGNFYYTTDPDKILKSYRIFLSVPEAKNPSKAPVRSRINGEETNGIEGLTIDPLTIDDCMYNLQGVRVGKDYKGIVIINGKKVIRK